MIFDVFFLTATMISSDDSVIDIAVKAPKMCLLTESAIVDFYEEAKTTIRLEHDNIVKVRKSQKHSSMHPILPKKEHKNLSKVLD